MKHIILVAATEFEILPFLQYCKTNLGVYEDHIYSKGESFIHVIITGVGIANTTYYLTKYLSVWDALINVKPELVIQVGIAGSFDSNLTIGEVVEVESEAWGDLGVSSADGSFTDVFELGLLSPETPPFKNSRLYQSGGPLDVNLKQVKGLTVNRVSGELKEINAIHSKYQCDIETMEGAAFFQVCLIEKLNFTAIRAISNYVEPRNKDNWNIALAIDNLNAFIIEQLAVKLMS